MFIRIKQVLGNTYMYIVFVICCVQNTRLNIRVLWNYFYWPESIGGIILFRLFFILYSYTICIYLHKLSTDVQQSHKLYTRNFCGIQTRSSTTENHRSQENEMSERITRPRTLIDITHCFCTMLKHFVPLLRSIVSRIVSTILCPPPVIFTSGPFLLFSTGFFFHFVSSFLSFRQNEMYNFFTLKYMYTVILIYIHLPNT